MIKAREIENTGNVSFHFKYKFSFTNYFSHFFSNGISGLTAEVLSGQYDEGHLYVRFRKNTGCGA
jgi:hypothetical protein